MAKLLIVIATIWAVGQFGVPALQSWDIEGVGTSLNRSSAAQLAKIAQ